MKITIITNDFPPIGGGISEYISNLEYGLFLLGHDVEIICEQNIKEAYKKLKNSKEDLVIASSFYFGGLLSYLLKKNYILINYGSDIIRWGKFPRNLIAKQIMLKAKKIVTISARSLVENVKILGNTNHYNLEVIPPGVIPNFMEKEKRELRIELGIPLRRKMVLSIGRLIERKGFHLLIDAVEDLDCDLYIIGDGPFRYNLTEYPNVHLLSSRNDTDKYKYLQCCDLFAMTPIDLKDDIEGYGIVYLEAAGQGKPVLGTKAGGVPDAIENLPVHYLVNPNVFDIKMGILKALTLNKKGTANREYVIKNHDWIKIAERVIK